MERIRNRLKLVDDVLNGCLRTKHSGVVPESSFVQFRKSLEELVFASLSANKYAYSAVHAKFAMHRRANAMLTELAKVNPGFYPVALVAPIENSPGAWHFEKLNGGYLTRDDFAKIYKNSSEVLQTRNPYEVGDPTINIGYGV